ELERECRFVGGHGHELSNIRRRPGTGCDGTVNTRLTSAAARCVAVSYAIDSSARTRDRSIKAASRQGSNARFRQGDETMKYAIWVIRLWYAGWMIPAGLEHFYHIYPQPGYNTTNPLAHEMLFALLHSHLFDMVKAVELITGISVLLGF